MHSQTDSTISASRIATIFSAEAFIRHVSTRDSHNYNNSTALSKSIASNSVSLASIGAPDIVRMTNRRIVTANGDPSNSGVGYR
ncbi:hypothetical protein [Paraburkholderia domus]|uniref:hypothetical protein n=1 Tax=Paraburkholderia domus TaxID=2793075 RepID=UPI001912DAE9|nr:hypothetical protein [Paraburkholderia domus]MBK5048437.1 hypothetical protein [Burkholderia sp. R-70006]MBK5060670.1 hypothetical protein [Burkholderia sp. R-70199]MBK5091749.1 hypothetical protein [Burkholderia sp. R-69927]MBK5121824.1 hypothetical protein [Burkholderia sp. R-69980]MBK5164538.1 hypothetical protein [Burkholderia sp. R-70211]MBK5182023.1 hypothetical protein [Burkholderia sp. R-69749]MCI0148000.1 hypothetical protein [Paraburkholderia sediminicola]